MTNPTMPELPAPAFKLRWHDETRYTVSKPNIGDTDCYTADDLLAYGELVRESCAAVAEQAHPQDWPFIGAAIRSMGSKGNG